MMRSAESFRTKKKKLLGTWLVITLAGCAFLQAQAPTPTPTEAGVEEDDPAASAAIAPNDVAASAGAILDLPIPVGQASTGVLIQDLNEEGIETSLLKALKAIRINEQQIEFEGLELLLTNPGQEPVTIIIDRGTYDSRSRTLYSRTDVTIKREDFTLWGEALEYNTATREGKIIGKNRMTIHDISDYVPQGEDPDPDPANPPGSSIDGEQSARSIPSFGPQTLLSDL